MNRSAKLIMSGCLLLALLFSATAAASGVTASLDRHHATLGDTVTLNLSRDGGDAIPMPDLSALGKDFQVLGQFNGSSELEENGRIQSRSVLSITLRPLHAGTLQIPALDMGGQQTKPLTLQVADAPKQGVGHAGDPAFLEVTVSSQTPYVGQQVALDVKLYYVASMLDGNLSPPSADGAQVQTLGRDQRYQAQRGGRMYGVIERHYAIIPQHAGTLRIPPVVFRGRTVDSSGMGDFFGTAHAVGAESKTLTLNVKPRPASSGKGPWLPAKQVEINLSGLPASGTVQVGEPVTVTLQEGATGLPAETLPEPTLPAISGADVYPDQTQDVSRNNGQWITGSRSRSFAIVPNRAGTLQIPAITLRWWNVDADREETATIPAHSLTVTAASGNGAAPPSATQAPVAAASAGTPPAATASAPSTSASAPTSDMRWRWIALGSLALWILSLATFGWLTWRRRSAAHRAGTAAAQARSGRARTLRNAFLLAARGGDPHATGRALLAWAQAERDGVRHLQDVSEQLADSGQIEAIALLQQRRYAAAVDTAQDPCAALAEAFRSGFVWRKPSATSPQEPLPPLYPPST